MFSKYKLFLFVLFCCLMGLFFSSRFVFAQTTPPDRVFVIQEIDTSQFPQITAHIRAIGEDNHTMPTLGNGDVVVYEDGTVISSSVKKSSQRTPHHLIFLLDFGSISRLKEISNNPARQVLMQWATNDYFQDGIDSISVFQQTETATIHRFSVESLSELNAEISSIDWVMDDYYPKQGLDGIDFILDWLEENMAVSTAIIYLGDGVDQAATGVNQAEQLGRQAYNRNIPIYTFDVRAQSMDDPLQALAESSGGEYLSIAGTIVGLDSLYNRIAELSTLYEVTYRSPKGNEGTRKLVILPANQQPTANSPLQEYSISNNTPELKIVNLDDNATVNRGNINPDGSYEINSVDVEAELILKDQRVISEAKLLVNGVAQTPIIPEQGTERLTFAWDIQLFNQEGQHTATLVVVVRDEFGQDIASPSKTVQVKVPAAPPPTSTPVPASSPTPPVSSSDPCLQGWGNPDCILSRLLPLAPWLAAALFVGGITFFLARRQPAATTSLPRPPEVQHTIVVGKGSTLLAKLQILTPHLEAGQEVEIFTNTTTFGRDRNRCDVQLYNETERSTVSALHCTLQYDRSRGGFTLTDNNSTAGSKVNGRLIPPDDPFPLKTGDEIVLGVPAQRGAKMRFEQTSPTTSKPPSSAPNVTELGDPFASLLSDDPRKTLIGDTSDHPEPATSPFETNIPPKEPADDDWKKQLTRADKKK